MSEIFEKSGYEPTQKEAAILEVILNPENRRKSISDICRLAGCSRNTWYEAFTKPGFRAVYEEKVKDLVKQNIAPVVNAFIEAAKRGEYQQGKVILEMAGLYNEKSSLDVAVSGDVNVSNMTRSEVQARIADLLSKKQPQTTIKNEDTGAINE